MLRRIVDDADGLFLDGKGRGGDYSLLTQAHKLTTARQQIGVRSFNLVTLD